MQPTRRRLVVASGLAIGAAVVVIIVHARAGGAYELRFGTAFTDAQALVLVVAAVVGAALVAGVRWAGVLLLASLWLPWYHATDDGHDFTQTGWQAFAGLDVVLVIVAAFAAALLVATLRGRRPAAEALGALVSLLALGGAGLVFYRLFTAADPPSGGYAPMWAAYVGLAALAVLAVAGFAVTQTARTPAPSG